MSNAWDDMRKAKEEEYFLKKNQEALKRLSKKQQTEKPRLSPITGEPMEQIVIEGVVVDRCTKSGGIWLDKGELEQLLTFHNPAIEGSHAISFLKGLFKK